MPEPELKGRDRSYGAMIGIAALAAVLIIPPPAGMPTAAWHVAGVALLMAACWITEALPIPATAMIPLVLFPLFGVSPMRATAAPYADPIIFLFLGGFIIGTGMQRWSLHKRIGLRAITLMGTAPRRLIGSFMLATALLSMWISNSATAIMMLPVAASVLALLNRSDDGDDTSQSNLSVGLMLAVAYGASIGGLGTLIGTPPNALLAAYMAREHGVIIGFAQGAAAGSSAKLTDGRSVYSVNFDLIQFPTRWTDLEEAIVWLTIKAFKAEHIFLRRHVLARRDDLSSPLEYQVIGIDYSILHTMRESNVKNLTGYINDHIGELPRGNGQPKFGPVSEDKVQQTLNLAGISKIRGPKRRRAA